MIIIGVTMVMPVEESAPYERMVQMSVMISDGSGHGSGVFVGPNMIATAGHIIDMVPTYVQLSDGTQLEIEAMWRHPEYDVGFVWVQGSHEYARFGDLPELGDTIYHVGTPLDMEFNHSLLRGIVSYIGRDLNPWLDTIQVDAWGAPGCSGGPVFNEAGELIALVVAGPTRVGACAVICESVEHIREAYGQAYPETAIIKPCETF